MTAQSASEISLSWSAIADATHYKLYRSAGGGSFEQIGGDIGETAYGDSGLEANTSYDYELEACNGNGCSARSAAFSATTALGAPTSGLSATAQSASEISLSWSAVAGAMHYKLYRSAAGVGSFDQIGGDIGPTDYVDDDGLAANTSYDYELEACNGNGCSARSAVFSATTALGMPTAGLTATAQNASEISIAWSAVADATHYKLYRSAAGVGSFDQIGNDIAARVYVDSGLDANTSYEYELEACNDNGCSARSAAFSATTALGAPTSGLSVTAQSASEISLSWSAIADATHYKLYRSAAGAELFAQTGGEIGATVYVDSGLDANTSYEYELEACNDNGCSGRSAAVSATTALGMPTAGLTATAQSASAISISWSAIADATHYNLYRSAAGVGSFAQIGGEIGATVYVDSGLDANTSYEYELEACNGNGCSARSAAVSATTALGMPTAGLTATAQSASAISISWSAVVGATHYKLYRLETSAGSFDQIGNDIAATVYVDSGLDANISYEYELEACNSNRCSARSAAFSATTALGRLTAGLTATAQSASEISISWSEVADATHYKLYRSAAGAELFAQTGGEIGATVYVDSGLAANTSYDYELEACNGNGCSARSAAFLATTALGRPTSGLRATTQSASEISLSWSAVADATHYKLYRLEMSAGSFDQIGGEIGATVYVDSGLDANTSYEYELEVCNGNGCSARSAAVSATTALGLPTSGLTATAQSASEISISWSAVADATHYKLYRSAAGAELFAQTGGDIGATLHVDSGLDANTSYEYELEACNGNGCSGRSAAFSATTALGRPTSGLTATAQSASEISISWSAVADATHYKLYRSATGAELFAQTGGEIGATVYVDSGLNANTSYEYELEACNDNGCSARSAAVSATTALGRPTSGLTATAQSASEISISWSAVADATHYKLYRSATGAELFAQTGGEIGATVYVDSGLDANTSYEYELEVCNDNGCSDRSTAVSATTALRRPTSGLTATAQSASEISIAWSAVANATHYKLYRSAAGAGSFDQIGGDIGETDYVDDDSLDANTSYDYELEACNGNGCSARSAAFSATTALGAPTSGLSATAQSASEISLSWSAVADATHYKLYRSAGGGSFEQIGGDIGETAYGDSGLEANTSYDYELEACNGNGCSARSAAFSATTALGRPTAGLSATAQSASEISISWSAVADATHYKLYRSAAGAGLFAQTGGEIGATVYVDSGLAANTSYDYELEACNGNGCSARSAAVSATTALGRPTSGLSATAQSASEISLSWSAVADATHYKLYRSETSAGSFDQIGGDIGETAYGDSGLDANTSYDYELEACNGNGCSARSAAFSATTALGRPTSGLSATAQSASEISLSWSAVADATHYKLYRSETSAGSFDQIGGDIGETAYGDSGLDANTSYDYELEACNGNGCSARSAAFSATTALGRPTSGLTATAQSASEISLSWSAVADATHYKLYRATSGGVFARIGGEIGATVYVDSGLEANTSYDYELEACNSNGCSARSAAFSATTALGRPTAGLTATTQSASAISISWSAVADATHYKLYRSEAGERLFVQIGGEIGATVYVDSGLDANTSYEYELEACNDNGCSDRSAAVSATTAPERPETPTVAAQSEGAVSISWSAVAGATHYKLYRSAMSGGSFDQIGGDIAATDYLDDSGLAANTSYDYQLAACNGNGCSSRSSAVSATTAPERPLAPTTATQSESAVSISWSAVAGATHYKLYRSAASEGSFDQIGGEITATDYVDDNDLAANTSYYYQLAACSGNGCSSRSSAVSATTAPETPETPTTATQSESAISISWSAVAGATHYKLYRSATSGGSFDQIGGDIAATDYLDDNGLAANTSYDYQLEACNGNGCSSRSSAVSATTAPETPETPTATAQSESAISISWSAVAGATHYKLYRSETSEGSFTQIGGKIAGTDYVDDNDLAVNTSYYYQLAACSGSGCSSRSSAVSATTAPERPETPTTATQSEGAISISWSAVAGATHYKLYRSETSEGSFDQIGGDITATDYVDNSGLAANTSYDYQLESCNGNGCSSRSSAISATTAPGRPSALTAAAQSEGAISISWSAVAGATHYKLYRSATSEGSFTQIGGEIAATDYVDGNGLVANTSYDYQLESCNGNGCSSRSSAVSATTAPETPETPTIVTQSESAISISWSAVAGATHYKLYRSETSGGSFDQIGGDITGTDYVDDNGLAANISYDYQLESCNDNGCSSRSSAVSATTAPERPSALTVAAQSEGAVSISWSAVAGATHYKLYRSETSEGSFTQIGGEIAATDYVDDNDLAVNTSYYYQLAACSGSGCSSRSSAVSATTAPERPETPTTATQSEGAISISWSAVAGATHYKLYRSETSEGSFDQIGGDITATDYVDNSGLAANTSYYYQLESCNDNGCSSRSSAVSATTTPERPSALTVAAQSEGAVSISWSAVAGATHYKLYRSETSEGSFAQIGGDIAATDYVDDNDLAANTSYYYQLAACSGSGCSSRSSAVSATTTPETPETPTAATQSESAISISWSAVAGATHYKLYRSATSGGLFAQIGGEIAATDYVDASDLAVNTSYYYQLEACNDNGCSGRSLEVSAATYGSLGEPRDEVNLFEPFLIALSSKRAYAVENHLNEFHVIVSYPVGVDGKLGEARNEITVDLLGAIAFSGGRLYLAEAVLEEEILGKIISYPVGADGVLGAARDEITTGLLLPAALAFSGERAYVVNGAGNGNEAKIISYAVGADGVLGAARDEITTGLSFPTALAFSGGRAYVVDDNPNKITSYPVEANGILGAARDEMVTGLPNLLALAFSGGRAYMTDLSGKKIISYAVEEDGSFGESRDEITAGLLSLPRDLEFSGRRVYVVNFDGKVVSYPLLSPVPFAVVPDAPRVFAQSGSEIEIAWNMVLGATHYKLYRSETSGGLFAQVEGDISVTRYRDSDPANTFYYYQLEACSGDECSGRSPAVGTAPAMPSPMAAAQSDVAIAITWSAVAGATHYKLYRATVSGGSLTPIGGEIAATEYIDGNLDANTSYYYRLESCNDNGCSGRSPIGSATTAPAIPSSPMAAAQSDSEISITWNEVAGATHYKLYRATVSGGSLTPIGGEIAATEYVDGNLDANTSYYYRLESCNDNGCSGRSLEVSATTAPETPETPTAATQSESAISISWSAVAGATHYKLYRSATSGGSFNQIGGEIIATDYVDNNALAANTSYYYQLESCNGNGCSGRSPEVSATTAPAIPSAPTAAMQSNGAISITWSEVAGATHYKLYRSETSGGSFDQIGGDIAATDYVDDNDLAANTSYYYRLEACNGNGCSGRSPIGSATTAPLPPSTPSTPTAAAQSDSEISITWSAVAGATHYKLYRATVSGGSDTPIGGEIAAIDYLDSGLSVKTAYYYRLEACNGDECSGRSPEVLVETYGSLGAGRDEITTGLDTPRALAFSGGRAYVVNYDLSGDEAEIISYPVGAGGELSARRDEITIGLDRPFAIAFSGGRAYVADNVSGRLDKIISYPVGAGGELGAGRDEITTGLDSPRAIAFSGGRAYVVNYDLSGDEDKIISYPVGAGGELGAGRDEITIGLDRPFAIAFSGGRAYVADNLISGSDRPKIISYPVGAGGELGAGRDEITTGLSAPFALAFSGGRAYVTDDGLNKIISYLVGADGILGAGRDEITTGLDTPRALAFSGDRAYVVDDGLDKIISYPLFSSVPFAVAPDAPRVFAQSDREIEIAWNAVLGATHYKLYRSETSGGTFAQVEGDISITRYRDDNLSADTSYYYQLEACNGDECSGRSPEGSVPEGFLGAGRDEITTGLSFPAALAFSGGRAYVVDAGRDKIISYPVGADGILGVGSELIARGLFINPVALAFSGGRAYVADLDSSGNEDKIISYQESVGRIFDPRIEITTGLPAPRLLAFSGGRAYVVDVSLNKIISYPVVGADGELGAGRDEITIGLSIPNALAFSGGRAYVVDLDSSGNEGKIISYPVGAGGELGAGRDEITPGLSSPRAIAFSGGRAYVTDTGSDKIISYPVGAGGELGAGRDEITTGLSSPGALAFFGGRAYVADGSKIISYPLFSSVPFAVAPDAPRVVAQSESEIEIAWNAVLGATHYKLYRSETSGGLFEQVGGDISVTRYRDDTISAGASYYYQLEACNGDECSGRSFEGLLTLLAPSALMATAQSDSEISITWNEVAGATHYKLYRATVSGGSYTPIGGEITAIGYLDSGLSVKTAYYYRLEACNSGGCSGRSPEVLVETYGSLGAGRDEITTGLALPYALAFSGGRAYVADSGLDKIISYPVEAGGVLGAGRDEITIGLPNPSPLAFSGGRAYVADFGLNKIISYPVEAGGVLGAGRDEITTGLSIPFAIAFSGGRAYVADSGLDKIISYPVGASGILGAGRDEITTGLDLPFALAFSGGRAYVADSGLDKIISYPVETGGVLGAGRDEITIGLPNSSHLAFSGGRAYVVNFDGKIISYPVGAGGILGAGRDEITTGLLAPAALAFLGGRAYVADFTLDKIISYPLFSSVSFAVAPDAPRVVAQSDSEIEIAWNAVLGATHYKLYRSETSGGTYTQVGGDISVTRYRDGDFSGNTFYYYQLEACSGDECSGRSPEVSVAEGSLGAGRDEITSGLDVSRALAFSGGRAYVADDTIISYPVGAGGILGAGRDEITSGLDVSRALAFSGGRAYVADDTIISYPVGADGRLGAGRDEITTGSFVPRALAFSGGRAYVADANLAKIISYPVGADGVLGAGRDEITTGLPNLSALAFSGGRAYVTDLNLDKIISYPVGAGGILGAGRDEITTGLSQPLALAFSGGRAYVADVTDKIISYPVGASGELGAGRDEITAGLLSLPRALAFSGRRVYVANFDGKIISYPLFSPVAFAVAPDAPRVFAQSDREIEIAWNAVLGATHYKLYRSETSGGTYTQVGVDISITRYRDDNLPANTSYYYQLEACSGDECSGRSPEDSITTRSLGAGRDEITIGLDTPLALAFSGGRAYVVDFSLDKIISYPVEAGGELGAGRDEITTGLNRPVALAFSGGRVYVVDFSLDKIISYPVEAGRSIGRGTRRDNDWFDCAARPRVFRRSGVCGGRP